LNKHENPEETETDDEERDAKIERLHELFVYELLEDIENVLKESAVSPGARYLTNLATDILEGYEKSAIASTVNEWVQISSESQHDYLIESQEAKIQESEETSFYNDLLSIFKKHKMLATIVKEARALENFYPTVEMSDSELLALLKLHGFTMQAWKHQWKRTT